MTLPGGTLGGEASGEWRRGECMERDLSFKSITCLLGIIQALCFRGNVFHFQRSSSSLCFPVSNCFSNWFQVWGLENTLSWVTVSNSFTSLSYKETKVFNDLCVKQRIQRDVVTFREMWLLDFLLRVRRWIALLLPYEPRAISQLA